MSIIDSIRRTFASTGSTPPFTEDDPVSFGAGVIKRLKLSNQRQGYGKHQKK